MFDWTAWGSNQYRRGEGHCNDYGHSNAGRIRIIGGLFFYLAGL